MFINNGISLLKVKDDPVRSGILGFGTTFSILLSIILLLEITEINPLKSIIFGQSIGIVLGVLLCIYVNLT